MIAWNAPAYRIDFGWLLAGRYPKPDRFFFFFKCNQHAEYHDSVQPSEARGRRCFFMHRTVFRLGSIGPVTNENDHRLPKLPEFAWNGVSLRK
jgi:hypothetical protein